MAGSGLEVGYPVLLILWVSSAPLKNFQKEVKETGSGLRHILLNPSFTHTHKHIQTPLKDGLKLSPLKAWVLRMCGCFANMCTCNDCVLYFLYSVF